jgi:hypothetical protein
MLRGVVADYDAPVSNNRSWFEGSRPGEAAARAELS